VERINSRFDVLFHTVRDLKKMKVRCGLALCVMTTLAIGRIKKKQPKIELPRFLNHKHVENLNLKIFL